MNGKSISRKTITHLWKKNIYAIFYIDIENGRTSAGIQVDDSYGYELEVNDSFQSLIKEFRSEVNFCWQFMEKENLTSFWKKWNPNCPKTPWTLFFFYSANIYPFLSMHFLRMPINLAHCNFCFVFATVHTSRYCTQKWFVCYIQ